jgi:copper chaperone
MIEFSVQDMTCGHCAASITEAVKSADPDGRCEVDLTARRVKVHSALAPERIAAAIRKAGFTPAPAAGA